MDSDINNTKDINSISRSRYREIETLTQSVGTPESVTMKTTLQKNHRNVPSDRRQDH